jgi:hypothetical protein
LETDCILGIPLIAKERNHECESINQTT